VKAAAAVVTAIRLVAVGLDAYLDLRGQAGR